MSEANVKAQAILIVIKTILKWIALSVIGICFLIYVGVQYEEYQSRKKRVIEDKVVIQAFHPKEGPCSKDYPYQYFIFNDTGKTIEKVKFTVAIKKIGFSSEINRYTSLEEDKIISHGESYGRCFRAEDANDYRNNLTEKDVDIEIKYKNITFKE